MFPTKPQIKSTLTSLITIAGLFTTSITQAREWTSKQGSTINAELVSQTETHLTLKKSNGKKLTLPIDSLSQTDQQFIKSQKKPTEEATKSKGGKKGSKVDYGTKKKVKMYLPTLNEGKGQGYFAYYEGEAYIARMLPNATLQILLVENGKTVDNWSLDIIASSYHKPNGKKRKSLSVQKVTKHGDPAENPEKIELTVAIKGDITADIVYEFTPKGITSWLRSEEGKETPSGVKHILGHRFGSVKEITADIKDHKKMSYKAKSINNKSIKYNFFDLAKLSQAVSEFVIDMPAVAKVKISMEKSEDEGVSLKPVNYGDSAMYMGYSMWFSKEDIGSTNQETEKSTITFK